jgi:competence protein ComEC
MRDIFTPVFILALAVLLLAHGLHPSPFLFRPLAWAAFGLFLLSFILGKLRPAYACVALTIALLLGAAFLERKTAFADNREVRFPPDEYVTISGRLIAFPEIGSGKSRLRLCAGSIAWGGRRVDCNLSISVSCQGDCRSLHRGDRVEVAARMDARPPSRNFFPNPFENYLLYEGIHQSASSKSAQLVRMTARAGFFWRAVGRWRERIRAKIEERFLDGGVLRPPGVFLEATLLGDRLRLEKGEQEVLIGSGVFHMLAISGANIGMLALISLMLCRWLRLPLKPRYAVTSLLLLLFLTVSGFDISAQRAVLMALLLFAARAWFLGVELSNIISFCGLLLLAVNPAQFLDPGFILTFALTAAILVGRRIFLGLLKPLPRWAAELLSANFSAALLALPLSLFYFQRYAFSGFFSGLLLAPLAALVTGCAALLLLLVLLPLNAAPLALVPAGIALEAFFAISRWIYGHLSLSVFRPAPPLWIPAAVGLLFFLVSVKRLGTRRRAACALLLAAILAFISFPPAPYRPGRLEAYFLDVGHGDAAVVVFPGGDALLIDGGGSSFSDFEVGRRLVLPFLLQRRIHVRWMAVTHYHPDHVKGLTEIIAIMKPEELWLSSSAVNDVHYKNLLAAKPAKTCLRKVARGFVRDAGGCAVACLAPPRFIKAARTENDHSLVLRVSDGAHSFLFTGDIEKGVEGELVAALGPGLASDVLKVPHHGALTSSSARFLDAVRPRLAVISVQAFSRFGFPRREVVQRLQRRNIRWLSTARRGGIQVASTPRGLEIEVSK